ncbi:MAG TPA: hypothetical protein VGJ28_04805, partial [Micromonosporaceae bacterium]
MAIGNATIRQGQQLRAKVGAQADAATRTLATSWVQAWDVLSAEMAAAVATTVATAVQLGRWPAPYELRRIQVLSSALINAQRALARLSTQAGVTVTDAAGRVAQITADLEPGIAASQLPAAERARFVARYTANIPRSALDVIVSRTGQQITSALKPLSEEATEAMNRELIRGVALGSNPRPAGAKMLVGLQDGFNGGLARATNIARTE